MTKQQEKDLLAVNAWEARVRRAALARLAQPIKLAKAAVEKEKAEALAREQKLLEFESAEDVLEAFGYDLITEEEYKAIVDRFEGLKHPECKTEKQAVLDTLQEFAFGLAKEARSFEWEAMTSEQQAAAKKAYEAFKDELHQRAQNAHK